MKVVVLSCSRDANSRSRALARMAVQEIEGHGHDGQLLDVRDLAVPEFDNGSAFEHPSYARMHHAIGDADGVVVASPVYNWGLASGVKQIIELTGSTDANRRSAWFDKVVTFVCSGGLPQSYMAFGSTAISLMLDFKCVINPYVVYATEADWNEGGSLSEPLQRRLARSLKVKRDLLAGLEGRGYASDWDV